MSAVFTLKLNQKLLDKVDEIAAHEHTNRSALVRKTIIELIEDFDDYELAMDGLEDYKKNGGIPLSQIRKELGLDSRNKQKIKKAA